MNNLALNTKMFDTVIGIQAMDNSCIDKGREIFEQYKAKHIIIDSSFSDIRWQFSDEYSNVGMQFNFNEVSYNRHYKGLFNMTFSMFSDYVKTYVMFTMGQIILNTLRDTVNDIINDYWNQNLEHDIRLFYYPLYLWWQITAIIPLRSREFILTPRNCLEEKKDGTYITLRRNKLKGGNGTVSYQIDEDYVKVQYKIPDKLAATIKEYIRLTNNFAPTELETLFVSDTHYTHWGHTKHKNSRYFTYINLHCVLRYFFHDVIEGHYHLKVIHDRSATHLNEGEINYLYLGDTRHLALINIIAEGGTPVLAMMLAGHENMEMSAHYYSNITHLIECRTYKQYRKVLKGNVSYNISPKITLPDTVRSCQILEDGGKCYSTEYSNGSIADCIKAVGKNGEIGYCPECTFYSKKDRFSDDDGRYKRKIEDDCKFLKEIVRQVRLGITDKEDIIQALNRLQSSSLTYQKYFEQKTKYLTEKGETLWEEKQK